MLYRFQYRSHSALTLALKQRLAHTETPFPPPFTPQGLFGKVHSEEELEEKEQELEEMGEGYCQAGDWSEETLYNA